MPWMDQYNLKVDWGRKVVKSKGWKIFGDRIKSHSRNLFSHVIGKTAITSNDIYFLGLIRDIHSSKYNLHISIIFRDIIEEYNDLFATDLSIELPSQRRVDHKIEIFPGSTHYCKTTYRLAPNELDKGKA